MPDQTTDTQFLERALQLASESIGLASPNPYVGAVIVDAQGTTVGTGTHTYDRVKHAEILALEQASLRARGSTLYINLEPCAHAGRTGPCSDAIISAGVRRVVASMPDPNPLVSGRGFDKLRNAGIEVEIGLLGEAARQLNESFARYIRSRRPLVTLKSAMTLDAKIAPRPDQAKKPSGQLAAGFSGTWITGELARAHAQQLRHQHDALLVGIGTILTDNPVLTDRSGRPRRRRLLRVILDSHLRLPLESQLVQSASESRQSDVLVFCCGGDFNRRSELERHGIRIEELPAAADHRPDLAAVLRRLGELEITSLMIEGGSTVNAAAVASGLVDKIFFYYAPKILAEPGSVPFAAGTRGAAIPDVVPVKSPRLHRFGDDFALEGYLRDPYLD